MLCIPIVICPYLTSYHSHKVINPVHFFNLCFLNHFFVLIHFYNIANVDFVAVVTPGNPA